MYYAVDTFYMPEIIEDLKDLHCSSRRIKQIEMDLTQSPYNNGLTYSNFKNRCSVVVIGLTKAPEEFQNTFDHEKGHLAMHIGEALDMDIFGEEYQYLSGMIGQLMFKVAKRFLCEHCRADLEQEIK